MENARPRRLACGIFVAALDASLITACSAGTPAPTASPPPPAASVSAAVEGDAAAPAEAHHEPTFEAVAVGPLREKTPLQIVSVFPYDPAEKLLSPATEIIGFISDARTQRDFGRDPLRPLVVTPRPPSIQADQLLALAWGSRSDFSVARVKEMGRAAMRQTLGIGVDAMAYAPLVRDQGVTRVGAEEVAEAFVEGALSEYLVTERLNPRRTVALRRVVYEAGPKELKAVSKAVSRGVDAAHAGDAGH